jgi:hypothetical protein
VLSGNSHQVKEKTVSNVINFLEKIGQDAQLRHASTGEIEHALNNAQIDQQLQAAILDRNQQQLEILLGARTNVVCGLGSPAPDDDKEDSPAQDDDEISSTARCVASAG